MKPSTLLRLRNQDDQRWLVENATLIKRKMPFDHNGISAVLFSLAKTGQRQVRKRMVVVLCRMVKEKCLGRRNVKEYGYTPYAEEKVSSHFLQMELESIFADSRTMVEYARRELEEIYQFALKQVRLAPGLATRTFPATCPWSIEEIVPIPSHKRNKHKVGDNTNLRSGTEALAQGKNAAARERVS